ncbi:MAG: hypothetical protein GY763_09480 [Gammaproteobacteria bacterium]|nr:hypothetical protein [Gammaproteobacteria bacterium]
MIRQEGLAAAEQIETAEQACTRRAKNGSAPQHYTPTPPLPPEELNTADIDHFNPYRK